MKMLIKFNILWIEDQVKYVETTGKALNTYLENLGFHLEIDHIQDPEKDAVEEYFDYTSKYDLILVDWNFKAEPGAVDKAIGGEIIERIRTEAPFADIIFYSGKPSIEEELKKRALTGVYISLRRDLRDEAKELIDYLLHKTLHPKIMRGIIVSELSHIDDLCYEIIKKKYNDNACNKAEFAEKLKASLKKQAKKQFDAKEREADKDDAEFIEGVHSTMVLDSHKRALTINDFAKEDKVGAAIQAPLDILPDTVSNRNKLAHWKRAEESDTHILLKAPGKKDYIFDQNEAAEMRKRINNAAVALTDYLTVLSDDS